MALPPVAGVGASVSCRGHEHARLGPGVCSYYGRRYQSDTPCVHGKGNSTVSPETLGNPLPRSTPVWPVCV